MAMFSKYLPEFGWDPYVLTSQFDEKCNVGYDIKGLPAVDKIFRVSYGTDLQSEPKVKVIWIDKFIHFLAPEKTNPPGGYSVFRKKSFEIVKHIKPDVIFSGLEELVTTWASVGDEAISRGGSRFST